MIREEFTADIPFDHWEQTGSEGDPASRLLCTGVINGLPLHVEAYAVREDEAEGQTIADETFEMEWRGICALNTDCAFRTVEIQGREYVIIAQPYGN